MPRTQYLCSIAQRQYLGMSRGVIQHLAFVVPSSNDFTVAQYHRANWHITSTCSLFGVI
jgi:hypothetical protein